MFIRVRHWLWWHSVIGLEKEEIQRYALIGYLVWYFKRTLPLMQCNKKSERKVQNLYSLQLFTSKAKLTKVLTSKKDKPQVHNFVHINAIFPLQSCFHTSNSVFQRIWWKEVKGRQATDRGCTSKFLFVALQVLTWIKNLMLLNTYRIEQKQRTMLATWNTEKGLTWRLANATSIVYGQRN